MQSNLFGNIYQPMSIGMSGGNYSDPYADLGSWHYNDLATYGGMDISQANPAAVPGFADKLRDFNSQYGSTIMGGLQAAGGLWGAYNGMQQTKLVKQQMANSLNQWNKNYANQVASYNTRLEDRQNARVAAQGDYHQDTASYMAKNRLK